MLKSYLSPRDIKFLKDLLIDVGNELCGCNCCTQDKICSIFERINIAEHILYNRVVDDLEDATEHFKVYPIGKDIDYGSISKKIYKDTLLKGKFKNKSRSKFLASFYINLYNSLLTPIEAAGEEYDPIDCGIFNNFEDIYSNCIDDCCK